MPSNFPSRYFWSPEFEPKVEASRIKEKVSFAEIPGEVEKVFCLLEHGNVEGAGETRKCVPDWRSCLIHPQCSGWSLLRLSARKRCKCCEERRFRRVDERAEVKNINFTTAQSGYEREGRKFLPHFVRLWGDIVLTSEREYAQAFCRFIHVVSVVWLVNKKRWIGILVETDLQKEEEKFNIFW